MIDRITSLFPANTYTAKTVNSMGLRFTRTIAIACCLSMASYTQAIAKESLLPIAGNVFEYTVQPGDYLIKIGARFGVSPLILSRDNGLDFNALLKPGVKLRIDNRHIVPEALSNGLLINLPQRMLYYFRAGELVAGYPVGLGKPDWQTPAGEFSVIDKEMDKPWRVPKSIQEEMRRENREVMTEVPPGPDNPLGRYWLGLSLTSIGIHGTIAPSSIYHFQSHGCIRLHPDDIEALYTEVEPGETGSIVYSPLLLTESDGRIFIEVHRDIYHKTDVSLAALEQLADDAKLSDKIDWSRAVYALKKMEGVARDVTLYTQPPEI